MHNQRVARLGTLYKKGTRFRVGALSTLHAGIVDATGIEGSGDDVIAGLDGENGLMRPEGIVELFGLKMVRFSEGDASERYCQCGAKERFHKRLYYGASSTTRKWPRP
jgi:hypothetical protein